MKEDGKMAGVPAAVPEGAIAAGAGGGASTVLTATERTRCEVWSRVMGYFRPVSQWNAGKKSEWDERQNYEVGITNKE